MSNPAGDGSRKPSTTTSGKIKSEKEFYVALLQRIGAPVTDQNLSALFRWARQEDPQVVGFNPLNSTQKTRGGVASIRNKVGVVNYESYDAALENYAHQLDGHLGTYKPIIAALRKGNSAESVLRAVDGSQWGTHNFGGDYSGASIPKGGYGAGGGGGSGVSTPTNNGEAYNKGLDTNPIDWALNEVNSTQNNYSGLCDHFVGAVFGLPHSGFETAAQHWKLSPNKHTDSDPPVGTLVFWTGGKKGAGHVAVSLGQGMVASTDILRPGRVDVVSIDFLNAKWGNLQYAGWANPYFNGKVYQQPKTTAELNSRLNLAAKSVNKAGKGGLTGNVRDSSGDTGGMGTQDTIDYFALARTWQISAALINKVPELKNILNEATQKGWDSVHFENAVKSTQWWQTHDANQRLAINMQADNPADYNMSLKNKQQEVRDWAGTLGITLTDQQVKDFGWRAFHYGWNEADYRDVLAPLLRARSNGEYLGEAGSVTDKLRELATKNGVKMDDDFYRKAAQTVVAGTRTQGDWEDYIRTHAATAFPVFAEQIRGGMNVDALASGYKNVLANTLEIDPSTISLDDPDLKRALTQMDPKTGKAKAMGLWDFERSLRADPRWSKTKQAMNETGNALRSLFSAFGMDI